MHYRLENALDDKVHYNDQANRIKTDLIYDWLIDALPE